MMNACQQVCVYVSPVGEEEASLSTIAWLLMEDTNYLMDLIRSDTSTRKPVRGIPLGEWVTGGLK